MASAAARTSNGVPDLVGKRLRDAGWLTDEGRVLLQDNTSADPGGDDDPTADAIRDLCRYIFGAPHDVATRASVRGVLDALPASGWQTSPAGSFLLCAYAKGDSVQLVLEVGRSNDDWSAGITTLVKDGDVQAVLSYVPDYASPTIATADAQAWLREALAKVEHAAA